MATVEQAVRAIQREVLAALTTNAPLPVGVSLVADRISLRLAVRFEGAPGSEPGLDRVVLAAEPTSQGHQITVEFRVVTSAEIAGNPASVSEGVASPGRPLMKTEAMALPIFETLAQVFGAPGFDSSARASVFREALNALAEPQRREILTSLQLSSHSQEEPVLSRARQLIRRLAASGPAGQEHGSELLGQLATQYAVGELISVAAERWRTQSDWAAATPAAE